MNSRTIIVNFRGNGLIVYNEVAKELGLVDGQDIADRDFFTEIIGLNAQHGLAIIEKEINNG